MSFPASDLELDTDLLAINAACMNIVEALRAA
jgi:hypothetical protein